MLKIAQAKATVRERTESVFWNLRGPTWPLSHWKRSRADDEIPEIVVQIPEQSEAQDLTSDQGCESVSWQVSTQEKVREGG